MNIAWYLRRLRRMQAAEIAGRIRDATLKRAWRVRRGRRTPTANLLPGSLRVAPSWFPQFAVADSLTDEARFRIEAAADAVLAGKWGVFAAEHPDFGPHPDWFVDSSTRRSAPRNAYAFDIPYRDEARVGNIKYIWEPSRHHHLTLLAAAFAITRDERYAIRISEHLRSWWQDNPFLVGPHWTSGIEIGIRLIAWAWTRRLLEGWDGASALFEQNSEFLNQLSWHQFWLETFPSRGSSANNHLIAEAAGQFVAACAFPFFTESSRWREDARQVLRQEIVAQTFPSGLNRELATDYHGLVLELFLAAAVEGEAARVPLGPATWERIRAMADALAAIVDVRGRPPNQGDSDDGRGLLLDEPRFDRWRSLLRTSARLFSALAWWPEMGGPFDVRTELWTTDIQVPVLPKNRPVVRPFLFEDAGLAFLIAGKGADEIWLRCDHGPLGFLSIAAHGHADALSLELRVGGIPILVDPGTFCYHGDDAWRCYFRSTIAHNTLELMGADQSRMAGPFMWSEQAHARVLNVEGINSSAPLARWCAEHSGYCACGGPTHRRTVQLDRRARTIIITDEALRAEAELFPARLAFHIGEEVECLLNGTTAELKWPSGIGTMELAGEVQWSTHYGEEDPPLGWISPKFGEKVAGVTLIGSGDLRRGSTLRTIVRL